METIGMVYNTIRFNSKKFIFRIKSKLEKVFIPRLRIEEFVAIGIFFSFSIILFLTNDPTVSPFDSVVSIVKYFALALPKVPVANFVWLFLYILSLVYVLRAVANFACRKYLGFNFSQPINKKKALVNVLDLLRAICVVLLVFIPSAALLGEINILLKDSVYDTVLWQLDSTFFSFQSFLVLPTFITQEWITHTFWWAYFSLGYLVSFILVFLFIVAKKSLFRIALLSYILSTFIVFSFYVNIPSIDPGNFFIRNLHKTTFSYEVSGSIEKYRPSALTTYYIEKLQTAETDTRQGESVPVSCFPSLHALWGILSLMIVTKYNKHLFLPVLMLLIVMLLGGLYFAQHYLIDYLIAVPFAVLLYYFCSWLNKKDTGSSVFSSEEKNGEMAGPREVLLP